MFHLGWFITAQAVPEVIVPLPPSRAITGVGVRCAPLYRDHADPGANEDVRPTTTVPQSCAGTTHQIRRGHRTTAASEGPGMSARAFLLRCSCFCLRSAFLREESACITHGQVILSTALACLHDNGPLPPRLRKDAQSDRNRNANDDRPRDDNGIPALNHRIPGLKCLPHRALQKYGRIDMDCGMAGPTQASYRYEYTGDTVNAEAHPMARATQSQQNTALRPRRRANWVRLYRRGIRLRDGALCKTNPIFPETLRNHAIFAQAVY